MEKLSYIDCIALKHSQLEDVRRLKVSSKQEEFSGSFDDTLNICLEEYSETLRGFCFLRRGELFGMTILKRPPSSPEWVLAEDVSMHAFKIDQRLQGLGLGYQSLNLVKQAAVTIWPDAKRLVLTVDAGNTAAINLYHKFGMRNSGPVYKGLIGKEHRMYKRLTT